MAVVGRSFKVTFKPATAVLHAWIRRALSDDRTIVPRDGICRRFLALQRKVIESHVDLNGLEHDGYSVLWEGGCIDAGEAPSDIHLYSDLLLSCKPEDAPAFEALLSSTCYVTAALEAHRRLVAEIMNEIGVNDGVCPLGVHSFAFENRSWLQAPNRQIRQPNLCDARVYRDDLAAAVRAMERDIQPEGAEARAKLALQSRQWCADPPSHRQSVYQTSNTFCGNARIRYLGTMDLNLASPLPPAPHINRCAASEIQFDALYQFLRSQYRTDSFEGRNGSVWGSDYSKGLTEHHLDKLHLNGFSSIPANASASGAVVWFDGQLAVRDVRFYSAIAAQRAAESRSFVA